MNAPTRHGPRVVIIGGGLAGLAAALGCADQGARVTVLERRNRLGGLTWSFRHHDRWVDNGQHVFLRCCEQYLAFLNRIGARSDVELPDRLDLPVAAPATRPGGPPRIGRLRRGALPAPLHLAGSLLRYPHLPLADRLAAGRAMLALRRLDLQDPALDQESFGAWLARHGQSPASLRALWDLITVPTVNLPAHDASLAMAAKVFQTGLLRDACAADIGWSRVPLGRLHGDRAAAALDRAGVEVRLGLAARSIDPARGDDGSRYTVVTDGASFDADAVIVAVPHDAAGALLPPGAVPHQDRLADLGTSAVIDVHLVFDRRVTEWPLLAVLGSPVLWVFDRTSSGQPLSSVGPGDSGPGASGPGDSGPADSGPGDSGPADSGPGDSGPADSGPGDSGSGPSGSQIVAVSMSAADELLGRRPDDLVRKVTAELGRVLPALLEARLVDSVVTKERTATFRARPGTGALRPGPATSRPGLAIAGAWTDTGWPATMEGAVRSGQAAAALVIAGTDPRHFHSSANHAPALAGAHSLQPTDTEEVA